MPAVGHAHGPSPPPLSQLKPQPGDLFVKNACPRRHRTMVARVGKLVPTPRSMPWQLA
jgi:hypothetical protein